MPPKAAGRRGSSQAKSKPKDNETPSTPRSGKETLSTPKSGKGKGRRVAVLNTDKKTLPGEVPFDCHTNEPKCAAFLGFQDIAQYRIFRFSPPVLHTYQRYIEYKVAKKNYKAALEVLNETDLDDLKCDGDISDLSANFKLASILRELVVAIEKLRHKPKDEVMEWFQEERASFTQHILKIKGLEFPDINMENLVFPELGPREEFGENELEKYSRAFNLLMSLDHVLAPSRYRNIFTKAANPFQSTPVHISAVPTFMQAPTKDLSLSLRQDEKLPPLKINMIYTASHTNDLLDKAKFDVEDSQIAWEYFEREFTLKQDPRMYPVGGMWRDTLRREMMFPALSVDFATINVGELTDDGHSVLVWKEMLNTSNPEKAVTWFELQQWFETGGAFRITFTLLRVDEGFDDYEFEYDGPPLALIEDIATDDTGDVVFLHGDPKSDPSTLSAGRDESSLAQIEELLNAGGKAAAAPNPPSPSEGFKFPEDHQSFLTYFDGHDVRTAEGLLTWQRATLDSIIGGPTRPVLEKLTGKRQVGRSTANAVKDASRAIESEILQRDERHFQVESAFQGTNIYTGPRVDDCKLLMNMTNVAKHGDKGFFDLSKCLDVPRCDATFLDCQVNGAAWMLMRTFGKIPVSFERLQAPSPIPASRGPAMSLRMLQEDHRAIETRGGILADATGMGKTMTTLLYLSYQAEHIRDYHTSMKSLDPNYQFEYRPILILAPSANVLIQWADLISKDFKNLYLIIGFGETPPKPKYAMSWVSGVAMREFVPGKKEGLTRWPTSLRFIFDQKDARASSTVILTTYDTLSERILKVELRQSSNPEKKMEKFIINRWQGCVDTIVMDEGHKCRHPQTRIASMVKTFRARTHWFITATPTVNSILDILGLLNIQWSGLLPVFKEHPEIMDWLDEPNNRGWQGFKVAKDLPEHDLRRLIFLHPKRVESLLQTTEVAAVSELFPYLDALITLRRAPSSEIRLDNENTLSLRDLMPPYEVKTILLQYRQEEKAEAQWMHRGHARDYIDIVKNSLKSGEFENRLEGEKRSFPPTVAYLRRLCICSASTLLGRFDLFLRRFGLNTLVSDMDRFRQKGRNLDWFLYIVRRPGDPQIQTHSQKLRFLCQGSPKARGLCAQLRDYVLPQKAGGPYRKILFAEDTVPVSWFWELLFTGLYINTTVLHAQLNNQERIDIVNEFNNPKSNLACLISMFGVSTQGTNFHTNCSRVVVVTPALNAPTEIQMWGRVIRINQKEKVIVVRLKTADSHDQYRDSKQADKAFMDLATRALNDDIQALLVDLLNEGNAEVRRAHDEQDRKLREGITSNFLGPAFDTSTGERVADTVKDDLTDTDDLPDTYFDAPSGLLRRSKRTRKQVEKLDRKYLSSSTYLQMPGFDDSDDSDAPLASKKRRIAGHKGEGTSDQYDDTQDSEETASDAGDTLNEESSDSEHESDDEYQEPLEDSENDEEVRSIKLFADMSLDNSTVREMRKAYWKLDADDMEKFDQDDLNERNLLRFQPDKVYCCEDLKEPYILERGLRLLFQARFGQEVSYWRISPHISYDQLPPRTVTAIEGHLKLDNQELARIQKAMGK